jgi:multidrug efflux system membrane fusion protein
MAEWMRIRWLWLILAVVVVAIVVAVVQISADGSSQAASTVSVPTSTAKVERRDLVVTEDVSGDLGYADQRDLSAHRSGVVTSLAAQGATVKAGKTLYGVDMEPTVLLKGTVPAYRKLDTDSSNGTDIRQLKQALKTLGYGDKLTVDKKFTSATASAVKKWEKDLGRDDPDGVVQIGDVVFAPGPLRIASRPVSVGTQVQDTSPVLGVTSTKKVVSVDLAVDKSDLVAVKQKLSVTLPDGSTTKATVSSVGTQAQTSSTDSSATATIPVVVTLNDPKASTGFDTGSASVSIEQSRQNGALSVPVTALLALAEGGYALQIPDPASASGSKLIAVKAGTTAGDYIGVSGDGISAGLTVVVPS